MIFCGLKSSSATTLNSQTSGIVETGLNIWTITSTPLTASIKINQQAHNALPKSIQDSGVLRVGAVANEPPFIFVKNGKLQGLDIDMMGGLAKALGVKIQLYRTSFEGMIPGLKANRFDVIMGDLTDTTEREKAVDFVNYIQRAQTILVRKGEKHNFSKIMDLCGYTVAGAKGGLSVVIMQQLSDICLKHGLKPVSVQSYPSDAEVFLSLNTGRSDALPMPYATAAYFVEQNPEQYQLTDDMFYKGYKGAAILKNQPKLLTALKEGFQTVISDPAYNNILDYWKLKKIKIDKVYIDVPVQPLNKTIK